MRYVLRFLILILGLTSSACFKDGQVQTELASFEQTSLTAYPLSFTNVFEETELIVPLSYFDREGRPATSCAVTAAHLLGVSTPCTCNGSGVCTVGVTGTTNYFGSDAYFKYRVSHDKTSNEAAVSLTINNVNDAPVLSQSCGMSPSAGQVYICHPTLFEPDYDTPITWGLTVANTCSWLGIDSMTGTLVGTPTSIGPCIVDLYASDGTISSSLNFVLNVTHGEAAQVVFSAIGNQLAGNPLNFLVTIQDMYGHTITSGPDANAAITISKNSGPGTLMGQLSMAATGGVATFSPAEALNFQVAGSYTLNAEKADTSGAGGTGTLQGTSGAFQIFANNPSKLAFSIEPDANVLAGEFLLPQIEIQDLYGNIVSTNNSTFVNLSFATNPSSGNLLGILNKVAQGGIVSWIASDGLKIDRAGVGYQLVAQASGLSSATSQSFTVEHGPADQLVWTIQPSTAVIGGPFNAQVEIQDFYGNLVQTGVDATASVSLTISSGPGSLTGTTTVAAVGGVAQWTGLSLTNQGSIVLQAGKANTTGLGGTGVLTAPSSSLTVALPAQLILSDGPTYVFGSVMAGATTTHTFTVSNSGGTTATSMVGATLSGDFQYLGGSYPGSGGNCSNQLAAGSNCTVVVQFSPMVVSGSSDTLTIDYFNGITTTSVSLALNGTGLPNPAPIIGSANCFENAFQGQSYSCQATALTGIGDAGDGMTNWSLATPAHRPCSWASIDPNTGIISGTPAAIDVGICNIHVQVNDGFNANSTIWPIRVNVVGKTGITAFSEGTQWGCASKDGVASCWGYNGNGQLGNGSAIDSYVPVVVQTVSSGVDLISVSRGSANGFACAREIATSPVVRDHIVCWGYGNQGQLGNGFNSDSSTPVNVSGLLGSSVVSLGVGSSHACALLTNGQVKCWGGNSQNQLGDNTTIDQNTPVLVKDSSANTLTNAIALSVGENHSCVVLNDATIRCWGLGANGRLGLDSLTNSGLAASVLGYGVGQRRALSVAAGGLHTCALQSDETLQCWGGNSFGQLGVESNTERGVTSGEMNSIGTTNLGTNKKVLKVSLGQTHSCAQLVSGELKCWGRNNKGQLGYGNMTSLGDHSSEMGDSLVAVDLNFDTITSIGLGYDNSCAVGVKTGTPYLRCWGDNAFGALGLNPSMPATNASIGDAGSEMGSNLGHVGVLPP